MSSRKSGLWIKFGQESQNFEQKKSVDTLSLGLSDSNVSSKKAREISQFWSGSTEKSQGKPFPLSPDNHEYIIRNDIQINLTKKEA